ncbi:ras-related protein Rap1-like [Haliotis rufescens]|uniref:ras-related protein Rap1-like n=1 Tax=Haliotis rufescens TaxID=6454 RepID=UPI00201F762D|nr:ras-related protein Rap1-like [Haliotis rufescens]
MLDKIVLLGHATVGKTSLIQQFIERSYRQTYSPTVEDFYTQVVKFPDGLFRALEIIDTSGGDDFPAMRSLRVMQGTMFIVVYAIDDMHSFGEAFKYCNMIKTCRKTVDIPILLAANKLDNAKKRIITSEMALEMARKLNCPYIEVSARWNLNVKVMFEMVLSMKLAEGKESTVQPKNEDKVTRRLFDCFPSEKDSPDPIRGKFPIRRTNSFHGFSQPNIAAAKEFCKRKQSYDSQVRRKEVPPTQRNEKYLRGSGMNTAVTAK